MNFHLNFWFKSWILNRKEQIQHSIPIFRYLLTLLLLTKILQMSSGLPISTFILHIAIWPIISTNIICEIIVYLFDARSLLLFIWNCLIFILTFVLIYSLVCIFIILHSWIVSLNTIVTLFTLIFWMDSQSS